MFRRAVNFANLTPFQEKPASPFSGTYQDLTAPATAAHIHGLAGPGTNAPVIVPLTISGGTAGTITGGGVITAAQALGMEQGMTYVNVHSANFPGGEIRGQLLSIPEPSSVVLLAFGGLGMLAAALRRRKVAG
ncbi:MAG: CHRD domain-containing protein [Planctomycetia bacterium]|nr:CHRD domain-containing protein [Planctomycetia bacterium]